MTKKTFRNKLNDLEPKDWLKFQKSWFIHNPTPRRKDVLQHPAKFPERMAQEFIEFFTKKGAVVLDPMVGTGSSVVAALRAERNSYGIELNPKYAALAEQIVEEEFQTQKENRQNITAQIITGDAANLPEIIKTHQIPQIDYVITSPPYWNILHAHGAETQRKRRSNKQLDVVYSDNPYDLGNIQDYNKFINQLVSIYAQVKPFLRKGAYLTIIVKNIKKKGKIYPLAWDLARELSQIYNLKDEKIWCQDNIRLFPYGMGNSWVSNVFHHYCLQFRNE